MLLCFRLQDLLLQQVCASEAVEPVISSLVSVLLKGCQDSSPEARLLCGECLGELGAVDPGRLDLSHTLTHGTRNTFVVNYQILSHTTTFPWEPFVLLTEMYSFHI